MPFRSARLYVIAVEGEKTEPWYFNGLLEQGHVERPETVKIEVLGPQAGQSAPQQVVARLQQHLARAAIRPFDQIWLVIDRDRHGASVNTLLTDAKNARWKVALSDPCFEIWLQFHFADVPEGTTSQEAKRCYAVHRGSLPALPQWPFQGDRIHTAVERGKLADNGSDHPSVPGSHVHRLVGSLLASRR